MDDRSLEFGNENREHGGWYAMLVINGCACMNAEEVSNVKYRCLDYMCPPREFV